jgi:hypothetical protein
MLLDPHKKKTLRNILPMSAWMVTACEHQLPRGFLMDSWTL